MNRIDQLAKTANVGFLFPDNHVIDIANRDANQVRFKVQRQFREQIPIRQRVPPAHVVSGFAQSGAQVCQAERKNRFRGRAAVAAYQQNGKWALTKGASHRASLSQPV